MKKVILEVSGLVSVLSVAGVKNRLEKLPGVKKAEVNYVAGNAAITYDEKITDIETLKAGIRECGYHCKGEMLPRHLCVTELPSGDCGAGHVRKFRLSCSKCTVTQMDTPFADG